MGRPCWMSKKWHLLFKGVLWSGELLVKTINKFRIKVKWAVFTSFRRWSVDRKGVTWAIHGVGRGMAEQSSREEQSRTEQSTFQSRWTLQNQDTMNWPDKHVPRLLVVSSTTCPIPVDPSRPPCPSLCAWWSASEVNTEVKWRKVIWHNEVTPINCLRKFSKYIKT